MNLKQYLKIFESQTSDSMKAKFAALAANLNNAQKAKSNTTTKKVEPKEVANKPESKKEKLDKDLGFDFTSEEKSAFQNYSGAMFRSMNTRLRMGKSVASDDKKDLKLMDQAFARAKPISASTVYRGCGGDLFSGMSVGDIFEDKAFFSTTISQSAASNFVRGDNAILLIIKLGGNAKAIPMWGISQFGKSEKEVLLNRGTKFKITDIKKARRGSVGKVYLEVV